MALKLVALFQGNGDEDLEWTLEPWGLGFCDGILDGATDGFRDGFGDNDRCLPRLDDLDNPRLNDLVSLTFFNDVFSLSSQGLLILS